MIFNFYVTIKVSDLFSRFTLTQEGKFDGILFEAFPPTTSNTIVNSGKRYINLTCKKNASRFEA